MEGNKLSYALNKCKMVLIVVLVLWVLISIVLIMPFTIARVDAINGNGTLIPNFIEKISDLGGNIGKAFSSPYVGDFLRGEVYLIIGLLIAGTVGVIKTLPKNEYSDIEHGSSDWATGEKYAILSKKKGIVLAEKHYLPVDKRGNVNVLVVGRIWCW